MADARTFHVDPQEGLAAEAVMRAAGIDVTSNNGGLAGFTLTVRSDDPRVDEILSNYAPSAVPIG